MARQEFGLFEQGNMVRIGFVPWLKEVLSEGLLSPVERARREGREISKGTVFHPSESLYVKFLRFESPDFLENFRALMIHIEEFGESDFDADPIGFVVRQGNFVRLWDGEPFVGIKGLVPIEKIDGIVLPLFPLMIREVDYFRGLRNRRVALQVFEALRQAESAKDRLLVFDHFGRIITPD